MALRRYPFSSVWREFDDMLADMEQRFAQMMEVLEPGKSTALPGIRERILPALRGEFSVDVREHEDEVVVVADLPGVNKGNISVSLIDPRILEISSKRENQTEEKDEGYSMRERRYGSMKRLVSLPTDVIDAGAHATFTNGVLELRLKKKSISGEKQIHID